MTQQQIGDRVRRLRLVAGLGQVDLAGRIGIASGSVSKLENGRLLISDDLLDSVARVLDCTTSFLLDGPNKEVVLTARPWLRAYADAPQRVVERQLADSELCVMSTKTLELPSIADALPQFECDLAEDEAIEGVALEVRAAAGIDESAAIGNTVRFAETLGCLVMPMRGELGRHLGLSTRVNGIPVVCVSRPSHNADRHVPGDRQRFTVAHELGHLVLHTGQPPPNTSREAKAIEKQAHRFAGALLAPGDALVESLDDLGGRPTLRNLATLKGQWGMSIKALVARFTDLHVLDQGQARSLYKQISARGWNKGEPVDVGNEGAVWLEQAIERRFGSSSRNITEASRQLGLGESHFERWTYWDPTGSESDMQPAAVHDLSGRESSRRRGPLASSSETATVTPLPVRRRRRQA